MVTGHEAAHQSLTMHCALQASLALNNDLTRLRKPSKVVILIGCKRPDSGDRAGHAI